MRINDFELGWIGSFQWTTRMAGFHASTQHCHMFFTPLVAQRNPSSNPATQTWPLRLSIPGDNPSKNPSLWTVYLSYQCLSPRNFQIGNLVWNSQKNAVSLDGLWHLEAKKPGKRSGCWHKVWWNLDGILVVASSWWRTYDHLISKICVLCILMQGRKSVCHGILWSVHLHVGGGRWKLTRKCLNTMVTTLTPGYMSSNSTCSSEVHHTQMTLLTNLVFPVSATLCGQNTRYSKSMRVRFLMVYIWPWLIIHSFYPSSRLSVSHQQQPPKKRNKLNPSCALVTRKDQRSRLTFQYNQ